MKTIREAVGRLSFQNPEILLGERRHLRHIDLPFLVRPMSIIGGVPSHAPRDTPARLRTMSPRSTRE